MKYKNMNRKGLFVTIEELAVSEGIWNLSSTDHSDIVLKSNVRFFRNLKGVVFAHKLSKKDLEMVINKLLDEINSGGYFPDSSVYWLSEISPTDRAILFERNILTDSSSCDYTIVLSHDQSSYFILGKIDHLELVNMKSGFCINDVYRLGENFIKNLENKLSFSYTKRHGYLTANPLYSGAGMEIFVTLHLPALIQTGRINEAIMELEKKELVMRSSWIDGYYEVCNKSCKGESESEVLETAYDTISRLISLEKESRKNQYSSSRSLIEDKVWRSYGILLSSRLMSLFEAFDLLSNLRLGISLGIINYLHIKDINLLLYYIQNHHLARRYKIKNGNSNLNEIRAKFLREYLKEVI